MGGSRRRLKRNQAKVRVGVLKRKKTQKAQVPLEVTDHRPDLQKRLQKSVDWVEERTLIKNYRANQFVLDPNEGFGRNASTEPPLKSREQRILEDGETLSDDDELRAACNLERKTGKAPPPRLTAQQRAVMEALVGKHGDDVEAMFRDIKLNRMQHSVGRLRELLTSFRHWSGSSAEKHDFRGPNKPFKRL